MPGRFMVLEAIVPSHGDFDATRRIIASVIRDGDGLHVEQNRLFMVLPETSMDGVVAAAARLGAHLEAVGAEVVVRAMGTDDLADSLYRRAEAAIVPAEPRRR